MPAIFRIIWRCFDRSGGDSQIAFSYSFDRPSPYSASEQATDDVAVGLSEIIDSTTTGSSRNYGT
ncbi:hypothetical protein BRC88_05270 [Halobacteriales archaeon QS_4_69_225]|nr:MAG: hypothetical protein BRC88_05270 [Halobacteriales archaeon QS_4_69_225]